MKTPIERLQKPNKVDDRDLLHGKLLDPKRVDKIKKKFEMGIQKYTFALKKCSIIKTNMPPNEKTIEQLPIKTKTAYVCCKNELFYIDKSRKLISKIDIAKNDMDLFIKEIKPKNKARNLSKKKLNQIKAITGHRPSKTNIIKVTNSKNEASLYAVYKGEKHGKLQGKGGGGKVKFMQNIETGGWIVLKVNLINKKSKEYECLEKLGRTSGRMIETDSKGVTKEFIAMQYVPGKNIDDMIKENEKNHHLTSVHAFEIASGMMQAVKELHINGIIHKDIKPSQFIYDETTRKVTLIDLGEAVFEKEAHLIKNYNVTPAYYPLELKAMELQNEAYQVRMALMNQWLTSHPNKNKNDFDDLYEKYFNSLPYYRALFKKMHHLTDDDLKNNTNNCFSDFKVFYDDIIKKPAYQMEKKDLLQQKDLVQANIKKEALANEKFFGKATDIYPLALSIGNLFELTVKKSVDQLLQPPNYIKNDDIVYCIKDIDTARKSNVYNLPDQTLVALVTLLQRMTDINQEKRPSLDEAITQLAKIEREIQQSISKAPSSHARAHAHEKDCINQLKANMEREHHRALPKGRQKKSPLNESTMTEEVPHNHSLKR